MPAKTAATPIHGKEVKIVEEKPHGPTGMTRVPRPYIWPSMCMICHGSKGPLVDTQREHLQARIYVCAECARLIGIELGMIDGARAIDLLAADEKLEAAQNAVAERDAQIAEMLEAATRDRIAIEALEEQLRSADAVVISERHLLEQLGEIANQLLQATSNGD